MKYFKLLFFIGLICVLSSSCGSDDSSDSDTNDLSQADIEGTWFLTEYMVNDGENQVINGDNVDITNFTQEGRELNMSLRFDESSGKVITTGQYLIDISTFEQNGMPIDTSTVTVAGQFNNYDYQINDDNITLSTPGSPTAVIRIVDLIENRFVFSINLGQLIIPPPGTIISGRAEYTFGK